MLVYDPGELETAHFFCFWSIILVEANSVIERVSKLALQVVEREGCQLYDVELSGSGNGRILRVYIDKENGGAGIEDCSNVSRGLNLLLDVEDPIPGGRYQLEVSTPGVERPLKKDWHYKAAVGSQVRFRISESLEKWGVTDAKFKSAKQFTALLSAADEKSVEVTLGLEKVMIPFTIIEKAHVVFDFDASKGLKKK